MKKLERYTKYFKEQDLNELIGSFKAQFKTINQVKSCPRFKKLSDSDKEYVIDELKADGWK